MKIRHFDIQNFRKLQSCRVELSEKETVFVGANNSGKTSAMDMLIKFLVLDRQKELSTTDFTVSNWHIINRFGIEWLDEAVARDPSIDEWRSVCPTLDVWLEVDEGEVFRVSHLIPTLSWTGGLLGVRLCFEPRDMEKLKQDFVSSTQESRAVLEHLKDDDSSLTLWPRSLRDFLDNKSKLHRHFVQKAFLLDPSKLELSSDILKPQVIDEHEVSLDGFPFQGLFRIDLIDAQRGFSDPRGVSHLEGSAQKGSLSQQLKSYYLKHLDPSDSPNVEDLEALKSIEKAKTSFDERLEEQLRSAIEEIQEVGYPGFTDPKITLTSKINPIESIDHDTGIQFNVFKNDSKEQVETLQLPEKLNGLGYKNLISIIFRLISFRDGWMRAGKAARSHDAVAIEPLHLVFIEEPEAHLHAQVQQVFINKAYEVLRKGELLVGNNEFSTQLVVSTHSSYIAHEVDFANLRYFKRKQANDQFEIPTASVVNLSCTFGRGDVDTSKYVARYLKTTHCDLFFANGVILVEGAAERMLVPHFIRRNFKKLSSSYISILEINGAHAHRLRPLLDRLGIYTLVISDLDAEKAEGGKAVPKLGQGQKTNNTTLRKWVPCIGALDDLVCLADSKKEVGQVRVAYQTQIPIEWTEGDREKIDENVIPYTFEDSLAWTNIELFRGLEGTSGMLKKMVEAVNKQELEEVERQLFEALKGDKAKMALDLLFEVDPECLKAPSYISEGLAWLQHKLEEAGFDLLSDDQSKAEQEGVSHE